VSTEPPHLTFSWRWMYILWNMVSFGLPAISAFISMATWRGSTDRRRRSCDTRHC